jgi:hypothetical protein
VKWFEEVWNKGRREVIDEMFAPECVLHDGRAEYRAPVEFKRFHDGLRSQLSDIRVDAAGSDFPGDLVRVRWSSTAKHTSTGKTLQVTGMSIVRFKDGRFIETWQNWDEHGLVEQLESKCQ